MDNQHKQIKGYRDLSQNEIDLMNKIKALAEQVGELVNELEDKAAGEFTKASDVFDFNPDTVDYYESCEDAYGWVLAGKKDLKLGFMMLTRAVAKPTTF
jgi:hypothetical protein